MSEILSISPWVNLGGWLFVIMLVIVSWVRGLLYPARQVDQIIKVYEKLLEDKDKQIADWKEAYRNSDARGDVLAKNQEDLLEGVKTVSKLVQTVVSVGFPNTREPIS